VFKLDKMSTEACYQADPVLAVIGVDGSRRAERAFDWYVERIHRKGNQVIIVHTVEIHNVHPYPSLFVRPELYQAEFEKQRIAAMDLEEKFNKKMKEHEIEGDYVTMAGRPGQAIAQIAGEFNADLVVVGTRGKGKLRRTILGSVSDYVVNHAPCPVVTVRKNHLVLSDAEEGRLSSVSESRRESDASVIANVGDSRRESVM